MTDSQGFQWKAALILFGVLFLGVSDTQLVPPLLPLIAEDLGVTPGRAGIVVTSYSLAAAAFALFAGPISDRIGRKKVLTGGLLVFAATSFSTYHVSSFNALLILRAITGFAAGTLSTTALSFAADFYPYHQRGRAMGILSMGYFVAFVIGIPLGALAAARYGWNLVFGGLAIAAGVMLVIALTTLPSLPKPQETNRPAALQHFFHGDRFAGIVAAFLTSGGLVGFLTYVGAWLSTTYAIGVDRIGLVFMAAGVAAAAASPVSGWLCDHIGKRTVIIWTNLLLAILFLMVAQIPWGLWLGVGIAGMSMAASARQAPLHALTTEIVGPESRGQYIAMRNAASQIGIAVVATLSAYAFDAGGFLAVAMVSSVITLLIPVCCIWLPEPKGR